MEKKIQKLHQWMRSNEKTLSLAESCTGGLLSSWITGEAGVSSFFLGSVISYASTAKEDILKVPSYMIQSYGEVSLPVARYMARGARDVFHSDWSVSITGIAGPEGGSEEKPVGTVCFAVCGPGFEEVSQKFFESKKRKEIQQASAQWALEFLLESLHH